MSEDKQRLLSPILLLFIFTMILANVAGQMDLPLRPLYVQQLGATVNQIGLFFTLGAIAPLLFQILGGWLSDSIGRLPAIAVGSLGGVLGSTSIAGCWLFVFRLVGRAPARRAAPAWTGRGQGEASPRGRSRRTPHSPCTTPDPPPPARRPS